MEGDRGGCLEGGRVGEKKKGEEGTSGVDGDSQGLTYGRNRRKLHERKNRCLLYILQEKTEKSKDEEGVFE